MTRRVILRLPELLGQVTDADIRAAAGRLTPGQPRRGRTGPGRRQVSALLPVPGLTAPVKPKQADVLRADAALGLRVVAVRRPTVPMVELRLRIPFFSTKPTPPGPGLLLAGTILTGTADHDRLGWRSRWSARRRPRTSVDADRLLLSGSAMASGCRLLGLFAEVLTDASYPAAEVIG